MIHMCGLVWILGKVMFTAVLTKISNLVLNKVMFYSGSHQMRGPGLAQYCHNLALKLAGL